MATRAPARFRADGFDGIAGRRARSFYDAAGRAQVCDEDFQLFRRRNSSGAQGDPLRFLPRCAG
jgi:hypothetical protein